MLSISLVIGNSKSKIEKKREHSCAAKGANSILLTKLSTNRIPFLPPNPLVIVKITGLRQDYK